MASSTVPTGAPPTIPTNTQSQAPGAPQATAGPAPAPVDPKAAAAGLNAYLDQVASGSAARDADIAATLAAAGNVDPSTFTPADLASIRGSSNADLVARMIIGNRVAQAMADLAQKYSLKNIDGKSYDDPGTRQSLVNQIIQAQVAHPGDPKAAADAVSALTGKIASDASGANPVPSSANISSVDKNTLWISVRNDLATAYDQPDSASKITAINAVLKKYGITLPNGQTSFNPNDPATATNLFNPNNNGVQGLTAALKGATDAKEKGQPPLTGSPSSGIFDQAKDWLKEGLSFVAGLAKDIYQGTDKTSVTGLQTAADNKDLYKQQYLDYQAPVAPKLENDQTAEDRANQLKLLQNYQGVLDGTAPSVAQLQLQQTTDKNEQQQMALAAASRAQNSGLAWRNAAQNAAGLNQAQAGQAALLRAQEQNDARTGMSGLTQNISNNDYNISNGDVNSANTNRKQSEDELNDLRNAINKSTDQLLGGGEAADKNTIQEVNNTSQAVGAGIAHYASKDPNESQIPTGISDDPDGLASDRRLKTHVTDAKSSDIQAFLAAYRPKEFDYRDGGTGPGEQPGRHLGVMAQDLERTRVGRGMVTDTPRGKAITPQAIGALLAAAADHERRLKGMERGRR